MRKTCCYNRLQINFASNSHLVDCPIVNNNYIKLYDCNFILRSSLPSKGRKQKRRMQGMKINRTAHSGRVIGPILFQRFSFFLSFLPNLQGSLFSGFQNPQKYAKIFLTWNCFIHYLQSCCCPDLALPFIMCHFFPFLLYSSYFTPP